MSTTFLQAVNRIFRANGIIQGDTDEITSFSDTQHLATTQLAVIAVQDELIDLAARKMVPNERASGTITTASGTRTYNLASDFISFEGTPHLRDSYKQVIYEYPGGLNQLRLQDQNWDSGQGRPIYWYWDSTTSKTIGLWPIPDQADTLTYPYEASILISGAGEDLPFVTTEECYVFCQMAGRRFKFMYETAEKPQDILGVLDNDVSYARARATLYRLLKGQNQSSYYGHYYPGGED